MPLTRLPVIDQDTTVQRETEEWLEIAERDLQMARVALDRQFFQHCTFYCQQAVEKLLKAIWTERHEVGTHPRVHNLVKLAAALGLDIPPKLQSALMELTDQIFPSRYPEAGWRYSREVADEYYNMAEELFAWLRPLLS